MNKRIFTGNYDECKVGNLISISGDRGRSVGFIGFFLLILNSYIERKVKISFDFSPNSQTGKEDTDYAKSGTCLVFKKR